MSSKGHRRFEPRQVIEMRTAYVAGASLNMLADFWNINRMAVWEIVNGRSYKDVGGPVQKGPRVCPHCKQILRGNKPKPPELTTRP